MRFPLGDQNDLRASSWIEEVRRSETGEGERAERSSKSTKSRPSRSHDSILVTQISIAIRAYLQLPKEENERSINNLRVKVVRSRLNNVNLRLSDFEAR